MDALCIYDLLTKKEAMGTVFEDSDIEGGSQEESFVEDWEVFEVSPDSSTNIQQPKPVNTQQAYNILSVDDIVATMVAIVSEAQELIPVRLSNLIIWSI